MRFFLVIVVGFFLCQNRGHATRKLNYVDEGKSRYENMNVKTNKPVIGRLISREIIDENFGNCSFVYLFFRKDGA